GDRWDYQPEWAHGVVVGSVSARWSVPGAVNGALPLPVSLATFVQSVLPSPRGTSRATPPAPLHAERNETTTPFLSRCALSRAHRSCNRLRHGRCGRAVRHCRTRRPTGRVSRRGLGTTYGSHGASRRFHPALDRAGRQQASPGASRRLHAGTHAR